MKTPVDILVVDDDDGFWALVSHLVEEDELLSTCATWRRLPDGQDALAYLARESPYEDARANPWPHLILMDNRMPRSTGTEIISRIKADPKTRAIPVCLVSSSNDRKQVREAYEAGASFCISKPLSLGELRTRLQKITEFFTDVAEPAHV